MALLVSLEGGLAGCCIKDGPDPISFIDDDLGKALVFNLVIFIILNPYCAINIVGLAVATVYVITIMPEAPDPATPVVPV